MFLWFIFGAKHATLHPQNQWKDNTGSYKGPLQQSNSSPTDKLREVHIVEHMKVADWKEALLACIHTCQVLIMM
jgi:hypothetical protein